MEYKMSKKLGNLEFYHCANKYTSKCKASKRADLLTGKEFILHTHSRKCKHKQSSNSGDDFPLASDENLCLDKNNTPLDNSLDLIKHVKIEGFGSSPCEISLVDRFELVQDIVSAKQQLSETEAELKWLEEENMKLKALIEKKFQVGEVSLNKAKPLYRANFIQSKGLLEKIKKQKGTSIGATCNKVVASCLSYVNWTVNEVNFNEVVLLATETEFERQGLAKFLLLSMMMKGKVAAWVDYRALGLYKKLGFKEETELGWNLSEKISHATHSAFCIFGFSESELIALGKNSDLNLTV
jgi:hypothetical protein